VTEAVRLEIARVCLTVSAPEGVRIVADDPLYAPFLLPDREAEGLVQVSILLDPSALPDTSKLEPLFETRHGWRASGDGAELVLEHWMGARRDRPLWVARLDAGGHRVTVLPGPDLVRKRAGVAVVENPLRYPLDQLLLMHVLPHHQGLLVHAAGVRAGSSALVFPGCSGAGKSTLCRLLLGRRDLVGLSDDRIVVRRIGEGFTAFGTPWAGTEGVARNEGATLRALAFLRQAKENRLEPLSPKEALDQLLPITSILWHDTQRSAEALSTCASLLDRVPAYRLHFRDTPDVASFLGSGLGF
jgi:hypothetical protein